MSRFVLKFLQNAKPGVPLGGRTGRWNANGKNVVHVCRVLVSFFVFVCCFCCVVSLDTRSFGRDCCSFSGSVLWLVWRDSLWLLPWKSYLVSMYIGTGFNVVSYMQISRKLPLLRLFLHRPSHRMQARSPNTGQVCVATDLNVIPHMQTWQRRILPQKVTVDRCTFVFYVWTKQSIDDWFCVWLWQHANSGVALKNLPGHKNASGLRDATGVQNARVSLAAVSRHQTRTV